MIAYFNVVKSSHPHLRGLPVVEPNSLPSVLNKSPSLPVNSVEKGPSPTRVHYALKTPNTSPILVGETPNPAQTPAVIVFDEVTYG